jgi:inosose dehydratase
MKRRSLLALISSTAVIGASDGRTERRIATNTYPWRTFAKRSGNLYIKHSDNLLSAISSTGIKGYEPIIDKPGEFKGLEDKLRKHGLSMDSIYVNSTLHDPNEIEGSVNRVLSIAKEAKKLGCRIIVTNPSPIRWGGLEDKSDSQLKIQAETLQHLGRELRTREGIQLGYHTHDAEMRQGAREFHHMLSATSPEDVRLCLDSHWIFRGCGNSQVALFDSIDRYADRIEELHLRQSSNGVWNEVFSMNGDIDYRRLFEFLEKKKINPHLVLEQAIEADSPKLLDAKSAHQKSCEALFKGL